MLLLLNLAYIVNSSGGDGHSKKAITLLRPRRVAPKRPFLGTASGVPTRILRSVRNGRTSNESRN